MAAGFQSDVVALSPDPSCDNFNLSRCDQSAPSSKECDFQWAAHLEIDWAASHSLHHQKTLQLACHPCTMSQPYLPERDDCIQAAPGRAHAQVTDGHLCCSRMLGFAGVAIISASVLRASLMHVVQLLACTAPTTTLLR